MHLNNLGALSAALCLAGGASGCADDARTGETAHDAGVADGRATGGATDGTGGSSASSGGAPSNGGASSSGGTRESGGVTAAGGSSRGGAGGRSMATGGRASTGGTPASGGASGDASSPPKHPAALTCTVTPGAAPEAAWKNVTANLAGLASECGNLTITAADPCSNHVIAGVAKGGLWMTSNGGQSWTKLGSGASSAPITHRPSSIVFDPAHPDVFYESGIYGDGVYKTTDGGTTFTELGNISHIDLVSVDFNDPDRKTLLAGAHETKQKLFLSTDGGATFTDIGPRLPAGSHFSSAPLVLDPKHFLLGACGWGDGTCGVFASNDGGQTWASVSSESPSGRPLWASDGHLLWTTIWDSGVITSSDLGKTWSSKISGPHSGFPIELPDARIVTVGADHLIISADGGKTWSNIGEKLPYTPAGVTYSTTTKTFFIWHNDCGDAVLSDAVMSAGFDYAN